MAREVTAAPEMTTGIRAIDTIARMDADSRQLATRIVSDKSCPFFNAAPTNLCKQ